MDQLMKDIMIPFLLVFVMLGIVLPGMIFYSQWQGEIHCKDYLSTNGYSFVAYHPTRLFGGSEECWGQKDGTNARVYQIIGEEPK